MATFPRLKTGAVMQYPGHRSTLFRTHVSRFVDGSEQRYREFPTELKRWLIRLDLMTEGEVAALEQFHVSMQGRAGEFEFEDPWDGSVYTKCSFEIDEADFELAGPQRGQTVLVVKENRS